MSGLNIPPWLLALCILVIICAIGASIVYSFHGFKEGFAPDCDDCDDDTSCGADQIPQIPMIPQVGGASLQPGMDQNIAVSTTPLAYSSPSDIPDTDSKFKNLLNAIKQRTGSSSIFPTDSSLSLASGGQDASGGDHIKGKGQDASGGKGQGQGQDASGSTYTPNQDVILPHQYPLTPQSTLTANVPTDAGTQAQDILNGSILSPSMRQMIRTDVKNAVREEANNLQNQYEITYEQQ